jgi:phosphonate transport system substrate-binding protein
MSISRRTLVAVLAASATLPIRVGRAQSWRTQYPELVYAVVPAENASGGVDRFTPFVDYLGRELGGKVTLRVANDYAAVIEGQRASNIHISYYGPASFARARLTGVGTDAFVIDVNSDGSKGYNSVFYVLGKSPYHKIEDLKGKKPRSRRPELDLWVQYAALHARQARHQVTGSHENAVLALAQGTVDVAANWWNADDDSNLTRMLT